MDNKEIIKENIIGKSVEEIAPILQDEAALPIAPIEAAVSPKARVQNTRRNTGNRRPRQEKERIKPEFDTKIIDIRRVTRVATGGRRFTFSVAVISGDHKGRVGVGLGKAGDTSLAIDKATRNAKKNMIKIRLSPAMTIPHSIEAKYSSAVLVMMPARGRGVVAGSAIRNVIELAGIKDVCAKLLSGSKNKLNIARATIKALSSLSKQNRADLVNVNNKS